MQNAAPSKGDPMSYTNYVSWKRRCRAVHSKPMTQSRHAQSCEYLSNIRVMCRLLQEQTIPMKSGWSDSQTLLTDNPRDADSHPSDLSHVSHQQPGTGQHGSECTPHRTCMPSSSAPRVPLEHPSRNVLNTIGPVWMWWLYQHTATCVAQRCHLCGFDLWGFDL